jgi:pimeloyl-ACP methyl ester carboxylesterase
MPKASANGLQLEYEIRGAADAPPVLLIMGLGAQLTRWPESFCQGLVDAGYRIIRYDNRDIGLSSKLSGRVQLGRAALRAALGLSGNPPYTLDDMAADAVGLLDALALPSAHVIGVSMGGMIGQLLAARHGGRVRRFVSVMSTSGSRSLPRPSLSLQYQLIKPFPRHDRQARIKRTMDVLRMIGSAAYPRDEAELRAQVTRDLDRSDYVPGYLRQLAAILGSPSRLVLLPQIKSPTLIVHGADDPLVPVAAAYDLQQRIPGAQLEIVPGMGHELPAPLIPRVLTRILAHLRGGDPA